MKRPIDHARDCLDRGDLDAAVSAWCRARDESGCSPALGKLRRDVLDALAEAAAQAVRSGDYALAHHCADAAAGLGAGPAAAGPASCDEAPPSAVPRRFMVWVDGVGSYLALTPPSLVVGRAGRGAADLPLRGSLSKRHAQVSRIDGDWFLTAFAAVTVNGQACEHAMLHDRDQVQFGAGPVCTFRQPTQLSATAVLAFASPCLPVRDARHAALMAECLILSNDAAGHVQSPDAEGRVVLFWAAGGLECQSDGELLLNGQQAATPCAVALGDRIEAAGWSFGLTGEVE